MAQNGMVLVAQRKTKQKEHDELSTGRNKGSYAKCC